MASKEAWRNRIVGHGDEDPTQLLANPKNWRIHPGTQQQALAGALDQVGWVQQVIVNQTTGNMVDGHLRVELAISRGEPSVPVVYVDLTSEEEALVLASLDPIGAMAATDDEKLRMLMAEVAFDSQALEDAVAKVAGESTKREGLTDPDDVPEPSEAPWVKPGDLFALGDHRLLCGDAADAKDVDRLTRGARLGTMLTDPPYGINKEGITNDNPEGLRSLFDKVLGASPVDDGIVIAFQSPRLFPVWLDALRQAGGAFERALWFYDSTDVTYPWRGWLMTSQIALVSSVGQPSWPNETPYHHDCYEVKTAGQQEGTGGHPTAKPVDVIVDLMLHTSGDVYEPFAGSGTTLIAAEQVGRRCYAMELEPKYAQVIVDRWQAFTGRKAEKVA